MSLKLGVGLLVAMIDKLYAEYIAQVLIAQCHLLPYTTGSFSRLSQFVAIGLDSHLTTWNLISLIYGKGKAS